MMRALGIVLAAVIVLIAGNPAHAQDRQPGPVTLRYGQIANSARSVSSLPLFVARDAGLLAAHGIHLEVVNIAGGTHFMLEALAKGTVDVSYTATPYLIDAVLKGSDAVAIAGASGNTIYTLIARPQITSVADLAGKTVGLSLAVDTISISTRLLLNKHGLPADRYRSVELVGTPTRLKCLTEGDCAAVPLGQPEDLMQIAKGYRRLGDTLEVVRALQFSVLAVRRGWGAANETVLVRLVRAFAESYRFMADPSKRIETARIIVANTDAPPAMASELLRLYFDPPKGVFPRRGELDLAGIAQVILFMQQAGQLSGDRPAPERFVDTRYLRAAGIDVR